MFASGDFLTPRLNGVEFFDKPPLLYWLGAFSFRTLGVNEFAARLAPASAAAVAVFGAYFLGRSMFGPRAGLLSGTILATTIGWPIMGRVVLTDMLVSSLTCLAIVFWWVGTHQKIRSARAANFLGFWTALALAVLAKGPVAVILIFGTVGTYLLLTREWSSLKLMHWPLGLAWTALIVVPWFFNIQEYHPEYYQVFWIDQNFGRFLGQLPSQDHNNGPLYFLFFLPIIFLPWSFFLPHAMCQGWKRVFKRGQDRSEKERALLFLLCGGVFITLFFSSSQCKLVTYILPVVPLMAVALGAYFDQAIGREKRFPREHAPRYAVGILSLLCFLGGLAGLWFAPTALQKIEVGPTTALWLSASLIVWGTALTIGIYRFTIQKLIAVTVCGFALVFSFATGVVEAAAPAYTACHLVRYIRPGLNAGGEIVSLGFMQSLSFYSGSRVAMVDRPDELRSSLSYLSPLERDRWFLADTNRLKRYFNRSTPVYIVLRASRQKSQRDMAKLQLMGNEFSLVVSNARYIILGNPAARAITPTLRQGQEGIFSFAKVAKVFRSGVTRSVF